MKAMSKKVTLNKYQSALKSIAVRESRIAMANERDKYCEQMRFLMTLGFAIVMKDELKFSKKKIFDVMQKVSTKISEISDELVKNKCIEGNDDVYTYDSEYNREILTRLAAEYNVRFDEKIFDTKY